MLTLKIPFHDRVFNFHFVALKYNILSFNSNEKLDFKSLNFILHQK